MYKATIRALFRHSIDRLNRGDASLIRRLAHPDVTLVFPGDNSWATMFGSVASAGERQRAPVATHIGIDQCMAFADRFIAEGVQFEVEDIVVNGPPWRARLAVRAITYIAGPPGQPDIYNNRVVAFIETRWGRMVAWEDYEDTERTAAWDARNEASARVG